MGHSLAPRSSEMDVRHETEGRNGSGLCLTTVQEFSEAAGINKLVGDYLLLMQIRVFLFFVIFPPSNAKVPTKVIRQIHRMGRGSEAGAD